MIYKKSCFILTLLICYIWVNHASAEEIFHGTVVKMPWTKSGQSFCAGGSEYYVLDNDVRPYILSSYRDKEVSKETIEQQHTQLNTLIGQTVTITGKILKKEINPTQDCPEFSQCPAEINIASSCQWIQINTITPQ